MFRMRFLPLVGILVGIVLLAVAPSADAAFRLRVAAVGQGDGVGGDDLGVVLTDTDGNGVITYAGSIGTFMLNITTGLSKPAIGGTLNYAELHLSNVSISSAVAGTIHFVIEDTDYTGGVDGINGLIFGLSSTLIANSGSSIVGTGWVSPANLVPDFGALDQGSPVTLPNVTDLPPAGSVAAGPLGFGVGSNGGEVSSPFLKDGPYSLFIEVAVTFAPGGGVVSFDADAQVVPIPSALALLLSSLPVLGLVGFVARKRIALA